MRSKLALIVMLINYIAALIIIVRTLIQHAH